MKDFKPISALLAVASPGAAIITGVAVVSTLLLLYAMFIHQGPNREGVSFWTFANNHYFLYDPILTERNKTVDPDVHPILLSGMVLQRRMMAGFLSGTPLADMMEVERNIVGQAFRGPVEAVGFVDLTEKLQEATFESKPLIEQINGPSFLPWSNRGRIFGIPHDVHPVVLAYRADIVEAAGIDVNEIKTWADFERITQPLREDFDGDGRFDRYPINLAETSGSQILALVLQAGGGYFNADMQPTVNSAINAKVAARVVSWITGPNQIAGDAPEFSDTGNQLRIQGFVVFSIAPDWLLGVWQQNISDLGGKMKIMPMPAWEWDPQQRRTSSVGGTMLGFPKNSPNFDEAWEVGLELYTDPSIAERLFETNCIISPIKALWDEPFYQEPSEYYSNQLIGSTLLDLAPEVPARYTHPYSSYAGGRYMSALQTLKQWAEREGVFDLETLETKAQELLDREQELVIRNISRNVFLVDEDTDGELESGFDIETGDTP